MPGRVFLGLFLLCASLVLWGPVPAATVHEECAGDATCEMLRRDADALGEYAVGLSCWHGTSLTLAIVTQSPCHAYTDDGSYIEWTTDTGWTYNQGDGDYYFGVHKTPGTEVAGWQTVAGTPWRWIKSSTLPAVSDRGFLLLGKATVAGGQVTAVVELTPRRFQPRAARSSVPAGVTRQLGACPIAGRWPLWDADSVSTGLVAFASACTLLPEWWGATGDGVTPDGLALHGMMGGVNASTSPSLTILMGPGRTYLITGVDQAPSADFVWEGWRPLTKSDVEIVAYHSEIKVPSTYGWIHDQVILPRQEARGLMVNAARVSIRGGIWNGNLQTRTITRCADPTVSGCDGLEFGIQVGPLASDFVLHDAIIKEWGTDNLYIQSGTEGAYIRGTVFDRARRNNATIVLNSPDAQGTPDKPIIFEGNEFRNAAQYPQDKQTRPGGGLHIEGAQTGVQVTVHALNNIFMNNRNVNVTLSAPGKFHVFKNNLFRDVYPPAVTGGDGLPVYTGGFNVSAGDLGGHVIQGNIFEHYGIVTVSEEPDEPWIITGNVFRSALEPPINMVSPGGTYEPPLSWVFANNALPNLTKDAETGMSGTTHLVGFNTYKNRPEYRHDIQVAANQTSAIDLTNYLAGNATYLVIAKGNNGSGVYNPRTIFVVTWENGTFIDGTAILAATPDSCTPSGRTITRAGSIVTFDNSGCGSLGHYGLIAIQLGRGDWGT